MFIYLSKKIAIPNKIRLTSLSWNQDAGWIACGGEGGLLKVLKLDTTPSNDPRLKGVAAPSSLSMNQTLEGHKEAVCCVTWNSNYRKLTTSDENGLIIVWMLHKQMWFEEMINNRNKSVVKDMAWTSDGKKICIVYEDGAVIVGSVDGNRLWGSELTMDLAFVQWSPDGRHLLFVSNQTGGTVHIYDNLGTKLSTLPLYAMENSNSSVNIIGIHWYDGSEGHVDPDAPTLAVAFRNGRVQITRGEHDDHPVLIDTEMRLTQCMWNGNGSTLALGGTQRQLLPNGEARDIGMVQFYNPHGSHMRTLKVPGGGITALSWEDGGLRIALAVDTFIYFANIRPDYKWGYFSNTLCYAFSTPERTEHCVVFWDTKTDDRYVKYVKNLLFIRAAGENCLLVTKASDGASEKYILILCNAIGSPVDSKYIAVDPKFVTMTQYHVVVASEEVAYVWQYRTPVSKLTSLDQGTHSLRREGGSRERMFHIDDQGINEGDTIGKKILNFDHSNIRPTNDAMCCIASNTKYLLIGRESGTIHRYTLPHISLEGKYVVRCRPQMLSINCNATRMSIIDINGILTFFDFDGSSSSSSSNGNGLDLGMTPKSGFGSPTHGRKGKQLDFERKDAWDMVWAEDNPNLFAMMEKTRMYIYRGTEPEEPVLSSGYLCQFNDLSIKAIMLDEIMSSPKEPSKDMVIDFECKSLRDVRHLLEIGLDDAGQFIEENPHPRLSKILAEAALKKLEFDLAEKSFVQCSDYQGIQFVKRLRELGNNKMQAAEVAAYFHQFDKAEDMYVAMDRKDLALELRKRLGNWRRVLALHTKWNGGDKKKRQNDATHNEVHQKLGESFYDHQKWAKAAKCFEQVKAGSGSTSSLIDCYFRSEQWSAMVTLAEELPAENVDHLNDLGERFRRAGMCGPAVDALLKAGNVKAAVDCCVLLNQWDRAVQLAQEHNFPQIESLLSEYASSMLKQNKRLEAIELYRKANKSTQAAKLLCSLAEETMQTKMNPLRAKKLYVLAALELERFKQISFSNDLTTTMNGGTTRATSAETTAATLDNLMSHDQATGASKSLEKPWHGAEGVHFYLLAHRQLYNGQIQAAMVTAVRCGLYDDVIGVQETASLIALTSFYNKHYGTCSKAFINLESQKGLPQAVLDKYIELGVNIFSRHPPQDPDSKALPLLDTSRMACVASGRPLIGSDSTITCRSCSHKMFSREVTGTYCPLCHAKLEYSGR